MPDADDAILETTRAARWYLLVALHTSGHVGCNEQWLRHSLRSIFPVATTVQWVRDLLDYLERRHLITIRRQHGESWWVHLDRYGYDVVEGSVECDPGIARPPRP